MLKNRGNIVSNIVSLLHAKDMHYERGECYGYLEIAQRWTWFWRKWKT